MPFPLPVAGFREREHRVVFRVESDGGVERHAFLPLESLDDFGDAGGEKLFHVGVGQLLVQDAAEHQQPAPFLVTLGRFGTEDDFPRLALGTGECLFPRCRKIQAQYLPGRLAGVIPDGLHEGFRAEGMPLYLRQGLFPAAGQFHVRHAHVLHRLVEIHPLFGRDDALAGTGDIVAFDQGGDDGGTGGGCAYTRILDGFLCLFVRDVFPAGLHRRQQGGFRVQRLGQGLLLRQPVPRDRDGLASGELRRSPVTFQPVFLPVLLPGEHAAPARPVEEERERNVIPSQAHSMTSSSFSHGGENASSILPAIME